MNSLYDRFRDNLSRLMSDRGLNQSSLARMIGAPAQSVHKLLRGKRSPSLSMIENLAEALQCEPAALFQPKPSTAVDDQALELQKALDSVLDAYKNRDKFDGLSVASPSQLTNVVLKFGGWNFLFEYLNEELDIRDAAERDYKQLRESLRNTKDPVLVKQAKRKMIISKLISAKGCVGGQQ